MKNILLLACLLLSFSPLKSLALDTFITEQAAQQHCQDDIVVCINLPTGIFHYKGQRWYGITKSGAYVSKQEAVNAGDRFSRYRQ